MRYKAKVKNTKDLLQLVLDRNYIFENGYFLGPDKEVLTFGMMQRFAGQNIGLEESKHSPYDFKNVKDNFYWIKDWLEDIETIEPEIDWDNAARAVIKLYNAGCLTIDEFKRVDSLLRDKTKGE